MRDGAIQPSSAALRARSATELASRLQAAIEQRCAQFVPTSIADLYSDDAAFLTLPDPLLAELRGRVADAHALLARWCADASATPERQPVIAQLAFQFRRFAKHNQQFLTLTAADTHAVTRLYLRWLDDVAAVLRSASRQPLDVAFGRMLARHRDRLRAVATGLGLVEAGPICREYAPALQMDLLGLHRQALLEPVLDLGCGEYAGLVGALRQAGVAAYGLDAFAPPAVPGVWRGDWLTARLGTSRWGTIGRTWPFRITLCITM